MNKIILASIKYFVFLFAITQFLPIIMGRENSGDILLQGLFTLVASIAIAIRSEIKNKKRS
ncbi:hypothetical protein ACR6HW_03985 [Fusibacter sp. JL298sf-3]